jgi:Mor family transcriptional regulator
MEYRNKDSFQESNCGRLGLYSSFFSFKGITLWSLLHPVLKFGGSRDMKYVNAQKVLSEEIIRKIQEHMDGGFLYIPRKDGEQKGWGETSGTRNSLRERDVQIFEKHHAGATTAELVQEFYLSEQSIRRILGREKKLRSRLFYTHSGN